MRLGYALSGGGSRGAYHVGIVKAMRARGYVDAPLWYGTSTGALIALKCAIAEATGNQHHYAQLESIYSQVTDKYIFRKNPLAKISPEMGLVWAILRRRSYIYDVTPLRNLIEHYASDEDVQALLDSDAVEMGAVTVDLVTGRSHVVTNKTAKDPAHLKRAVLASACQPVLMPAQEVEPGCVCVDGGILDYNPIEFAQRSPLVKDIDRLMAVNLDALDMVPKRPDGIIGVLGRVLETFTVSVQRSDLYTSLLLDALAHAPDTIGMLELPNGLGERLAAVTDTDIVVVRPKKPLTLSALKFEQPAMREVVDQGYAEGMDLDLPDAI